MRQYALSLVLLVFAAVPARANLIINGSFESPVVQVNPHEIDSYFSEQIPGGWSSLSNGSSVDIIANGYYGATASDGMQFLDLIGAGQGVFPSGLLQTVHLDAGMYALSFDYNGGRFNDGSQTIDRVLEYSLGNFVSGSINVDNLNVYPGNELATPWQTLSTNFTVNTTDDYVLQFATPSGSFGSPFLDNVQLSAVPTAAVPEPSSFLLFALGLFGLGSGVVARQIRGRTGLLPR
jgi:PEP-CTERM motif